MAEAVARVRWRPTPTKWLAGTLVVAGFLLTGVSWWFLLLAAAGTFGPGVLREVGVLHDKDEFQRRADHRAGYHAFLTVGSVAFVLVAFFRSGERLLRNPQELATLFLVLLWFSWFVSSLLSYWGARKTAARVLVVFGSVVLVFTVLSNLGSEWTGWAALLLHPLLSVPFFGLAWLSRRLPRVAGVLLVGATVFFFGFFGGFRADGSIGLIDQGVTYVLFLGPLLASGLALLRGGPPEDGADEGEETVEG